MRIAVHAFEGISLFHLAAPVAVFGEVKRQQLAEWSTQVWSEGGRSVTSADGVRLDGLCSAHALEGADAVVYPSWHEGLPAPEPELLEGMRTAHRRGALVVGLCLGAFPVAHAGLLDGREAVTHWRHTAALADQRPSVQVRQSALYIDHGDVLTCAGTAAAVDACLHLVRSRLGSTAATAVARRLVIAPHREGDQAQFVERPAPPVGAGQVQQVMTWALEHLEQQLSVEHLARRAGMSPRHFTRRFQQTTGTSPARWLLSRRLDDARTLLETTDWSVARIARSCGFGSEVTLRQNFSAAYATSPSAYRLRFADTAGTGTGIDNAGAGGTRAED